MEKQKETRLLLASEIAGIIGKGWSRQRVHVELSRGKFPEPDRYIGKSPVWTVKQIENFIGREIE